MSNIWLKRDSTDLETRQYILEHILRNNHITFLFNPMTNEFTEILEVSWDIASDAIHMNESGEQWNKYLKMMPLESFGILEGPGAMYIGRMGSKRKFVVYLQHFLQFLD